MDPTPQQPTDSDILDLWNNLTPSSRFASVACMITYLFTLTLAIGAIRVGMQVEWYVFIGLLIWPLILIAWLLIIWLASLIFLAARALVGGKPSDHQPGRHLVKAIVFIPTVIGTALIVVEVFVSEIFSSEKEGE